MKKNLILSARIPEELCIKKSHVHIKLIVKKMRYEKLMPHNIRVLQSQQGEYNNLQRMVLLDFSSLFSHFPIKIFIPTYYSTKFKGKNLRLPLHNV